MKGAIGFEEERTVLSDTGDKAVDGLLSHKSGGPADSGRTFEPRILQGFEAGSFPGPDPFFQPSAQYSEQEVSIIRLRPFGSKVCGVPTGKIGVAYKIDAYASDDRLEARGKVRFDQDAGNLGTADENIVGPLAAGGWNRGCKFPDGIGHRKADHQGKLGKNGDRARRSEDQGCVGITFR